MHRRITIAAGLLVLAAVSVIMAQAPVPLDAPAAKGKAKGAPRPPAQSPASTAIPKTVVAQTYPDAQVRAGEQKFSAECGFCHGRDAEGGETGPDLTRSKLVAEDDHGDKLTPFIATGRPEQGMPAFKLKADEAAGIVAYIHSQKTKFEALGGDRRTVDPADLATGNVEAGRAYFNGAGGCSGCHSATGDLKGIATRFQGLALVQRLLSPANSGRPIPARPKATVTLKSGQVITGSLASEDEWTVVLMDEKGARQTYEKNAVKVTIDNPLAAHFDQLGKYTDADMHNIFAYLDTLK